MLSNNSEKRETVDQRGKCEAGVRISETINSTHFKNKTRQD